MSARRENQRIVLASRPDGPIRATDFRLEDAEVPVPRDGELLLETLLLSIDPYMRWWVRAEKSYNDPIEIGQVMVGGTVSRVLQSNHPDWHVDDVVLGRSGWCRFAISDGKDLRRLDPQSAPTSTALGVLGMTGFTAYAGLRNIGRPKPGETVVVAAASGAVGSVVGQIARLRGAKAIGITTGSEKLAYVRHELRFDAVADHRAPDFADQLARACPNGIDVYFENVGGAVWDAVLPLLNTYARVPVCGLISQYDGGDDGAGVDRLPGTMAQVMGKSLELRGFIQTEFAKDQMDDFLREASEWVRQGELRYREDIVKGLENAPDALAGLLKGKNFGKAIVEVASSSGSSDAKH